MLLLPLSFLVVVDFSPLLLFCLFIGIVHMLVHGWLFFFLSFLYFFFSYQAQPFFLFSFLLDALLVVLIYMFVVIKKN